MKSTRFYYSEPIHKFRNHDISYILGELAKAHAFTIEQNQRNAWEFQIRSLRGWLQGVNGHIIFEYTIPRMGKRVDCIIISEAVIFVIEFKVGASKYERQSINQVVDYVLDLKNFHKESHHKYIVPILICTEAKNTDWHFEFYEDKTAKPILTNGSSLRDIIFDCTPSIKGEPINVLEWIGSIYTPTPTIIEAAQLLYQNHRVEEISRSDAGAFNLSQTTKTISNIIQRSKTNHKKSICFLTGVPGAGKTLAGLNIANCWHGEENSEHAVFLSGNGPLVDVLCEALAKNDVTASLEKGMEANKSNSRRKAKTFIRNIHHFRDHGLESSGPPLEHVVIFDEAQRAWDQKQTSSFMKNKRGIFSFNQSEPEFLIRLMDRHVDWATIICLVGEGQEINTGEAGIQEWFNALEKHFPDWSIYASSRFSNHVGTHQKEYSSYLAESANFVNGLHLATSIRSFRSENVAAFVEAILNCDVSKARQLYREFENDYPIVVTRCLENAKNWLKLKARGTERYGLIASSGAIRLKPHGIYVKNKIDPKNWFLNDESDIRSSYYLEDVATEFDIQGLELDWTCLAWDADLHHDGSNWIMKSFRGTAWQNINDENKRSYLKNSYRVLLSRARQGMVIFIPKGDDSDKTRQKAFYDHTYSYFVSIGIKSM